MMHSLLLKQIIKMISLSSYVFSFAFTVPVEKSITENKVMTRESIIIPEEMADADGLETGEGLPAEGDQTYYCEGEIYNPYYYDLLSDWSSFELLEADASADQEQDRKNAKGSSTYCQSVDEISSELMRHMRNFETSVFLNYVIDDQNADVLTLCRAAYYYVLDHDDYLKGTVQKLRYGGPVTITAEGKQIGKLKFEITYYISVSQEEEFCQMLKQTVDSLDIYDKSDYEKTRKINEFICQHVYYDYSDDTSEYMKYTAYSALIKRSAVCQGYSLLFYRMAQLAGLDSHFITGISLMGAQEKHGWNTVRIDGTYYLIDTTWNSIRVQAGGDSRWFLCGTDTFASDHQADQEYGPEVSRDDYIYQESDIIPVTGIIISTEQDTIAAGEFLFLEAHVIPENATNQYIRFYSDDSEIAQTDQYGKITGIQPGRTTIHAVTSDGDFSAEYNVEVTDNIVYSYTITAPADNAAYVYYGKTYQTEYTVTPESDLEYPMSYYSNHPEIADIDNNGLVTTYSPGLVYLYFVPNEHVDINDGFPLAKPLQIVGIKMIRDTVLLEQDDEYTLTSEDYVYYPADIGAVIEWSSSDEGIASVSNQGVITAISPGETEITAKAGDRTATCTVIVKEAKPLKNGLIQDPDGQWRLYQNGDVRTNFTGLYPYGTSLFYLNQGVLDRTYEGIEYYQKAPYYVVKGQVTYNYTGLGEYKGSLHYFTKSVKDETFNGIAYYKGDPYFVVNGKVTYNYVGLGEYKGSLHYFTKSKKDTTFTGLSYYKNEPYYVLNGIVSYKYNGLGQYKEDWWYVVNSKVDKSFSGNYRWKSKDYTIKNGKVVN